MNPFLKELSEKDPSFVWIDEQSGYSDQGLHYSKYFKTPNGGLILREALEPHEPQSIPWLRKQAGV